MKTISPLRLGLTFAGSFLGAGYVSGQEIWQFFGRFGIGAHFLFLLGKSLFLFLVCLLNNMDNRRFLYRSFFVLRLHGKLFFFRFFLLTDLHRLGHNGYPVS